MSDLSFHFSLSVLEHLGKGLYRSLATVVAEAISNAWDADATRVDVELRQNLLIIRDNGHGMTREDVQGKFLNIGYRKRKSKDTQTTPGGRKVLGRKGIGKLAYLSISEYITIHTRPENGEYTCARISNARINQHIEGMEDDQSDGYKLEIVPDDEKMEIEKSGTVLVFDILKPGVIRKNIRQNLATHFHFANVLRKGDTFSIHMDEGAGAREVGFHDLKSLYEKVELIWFADKRSEEDFMNRARSADIDTKSIKVMRPLGVEFVHEFGVFGFIASVQAPADLRIYGSKGELKTGISLFAGGRMRDSDLLSRMSTDRIPESYLFGQIHADVMDDGEDRFTSNREGVLESDPLFANLRRMLIDEVRKVISDWTGFRTERPDDELPLDKAIKRLFNRWWEDSGISIRKGTSAQKAADELTNAARQNLGSYIDCFVAENMARSFIDECSIPLTDYMKEEIGKAKRSEKDGAKRHDLSDPISHAVFGNSGVDYMSLVDMAAAIDKSEGTSKNPDSLGVSARRQVPIRNALMHGRRLTSDAKAEGHLAWIKIIHKVVDLMEKRVKKEK